MFKVFQFLVGTSKRTGIRLRGPTGQDPVHTLESEPAGQKVLRKKFKKLTFFGSKSGNRKLLPAASSRAAADQADTNRTILGV